MADYKKIDHWQEKARKEGYPARSVYKLKEIDEKFPVFKPVSSINSGNNMRILDIGAAPGSWSLYVLRKFGARCLLSAVDLSPLSREFDKGLFDGGNFFFIQGDITSVQVRGSLFEKGPYSTIISDAAPSTTGNHTVDSTRSLAIAEEVVNYAENTLAVCGNLALKVFQGGDSAALLKRMKLIFETAKSFKPQACRGESVETYYLGLNKRKSAT
ncbi:MAG: RlmE family RNA methyltransferase [Treponema sp.]|jgi:23S rRNA (uridine2552-2'-O)-methyltransferase|nr:RlmE family RNA methyltransferase [Treponema sp.]